MKTRKKSYRIVRRAGQQGTRPSGKDQPEVEKSATESDSSLNECPSGNQNGSCPNPGPSGSPPKKNQKEKRKKWTREEHKEVMYCFYYALEKPQTNNTEDTFLTWFRRNSDSDKVDGMDANKLANVRRYIMRSKKLTDMEIELIKEQVKIDTRMPEGDETNDNFIQGVEDEGPHENERPNENEINAHEVENVVEYDRQNRNVVNEGDFDREEINSMKTDILEELSIVMHTDISEREPLLKIRQIHKSKKIFNLGNIALREICIERDPDLTNLNQLIYATSKVLQEKSGVKSKRKRNKGKRQGPSKPKWQKQIDKEIENFRKEISILDELQRNGKSKSRKSRHVVRNIRLKIKNKYLPLKKNLNKNYK